MKFSSLSVLTLVLLLSCSSAEANRKAIVSNSDPEEIFFEKEKQSVKPEVVPTPEVATKSVPEKAEDFSGSYDEVGMSSWYGDKFHGRPTASGELFNKNELTAAHRTLPLGTIVAVQNLENQKEIQVKINDRGPFIDGRIIDVSEKAAENLSFKDQGVAKVGIKVVKKPGAPNTIPADVVENKPDPNWEEEAELLETSKPKKPVTKKPEKPSTASFTPVKSNAKPNKDQATDEKPAKSVANPSEEPNGFSVQAGVFSDSSRANALKSTIQKEFKEPVFVFEKDGKHFVQVGDFKNREQALEFRNKLKEIGIETYVPRK